MSFLNRIETTISSKINSLLNRIEDPRETLDYSYEKQLELLQQTKKGIVEVTTSKKRLQLQKAKLSQDIEKYDSQAKASVEANREDLAREALERKQAANQQIINLDTQISDLEVQETKLIEAEKKLSTQVEIFRSKKESIKAQYTAAQAQVKVSESMTGISKEMSDVGNAIERAENKTEEMKARAAAIDELTDAGTLEDLTGEKKDDIDRELAKISKQNNVESELVRLKAEMGKE
jgi:phage shock protein A